ncbi:MAG: FAD-dependent oxidoreductase [Patescibacteria group bacterium]
MIYDLIILGAGPAGAASAVYAARKRLKTLLITESFGGQSVVSDDIQNWIGETHITGFDLAKKFEDHVRSFGDIVEIKLERALEIKKTEENFSAQGGPASGWKVKTDSGEFEARAVILAIGASRRKLNVPGEQKFEGRGVVYCSTCDAPLFEGKIAAVIGGGNAGLEAVVDLFPYSPKIYLLIRGDAMKGDPATQEEINKNTKVEIIYNAETKEVLGDKFVESLKYQDLKTGELKEIKVGGVFVEIGSVPNSEIVKGLVELDQWGQVKIDSKHAITSQPGIFAAGDITDDPYKQNNISAGDAVKAALAAYAYLQKRQKHPPAAS